MVGGRVPAWAGVDRGGSLDAFPAHPDAAGAADVEEARDGSRTLLVSLDADKVPDTYREVWLIRKDAGALISLGVLSGGRGSLKSLTASTWRSSGSWTSAEPLDGDPAHSGDSIVRGDSPSAEYRAGFVSHRERCAPGGTRTPNPFLRTELLFH